MRKPLIKLYFKDNNIDILSHVQDKEVKRSFYQNLDVTMHGPIFCELRMFDRISTKTIFTC